MRFLQKLLRKPITNKGIVAISFFVDGFAFAVTNYRDQGRPRLLHCEFIEIEPLKVGAELQNLVKRLHLEEYDCHILLTPNQYRSISIEMPAVNAEEIKEAVRWRIADVLDYPVEQALIDFYPLPKSNRINSPAMLEVVAASGKMLAKLSQQCKQAGLNLKVIDVQETVLRNLAFLLRDNKQGIALLHLQKDNGHIIIQKGGELYLSRQLTTGYQHLDENSQLINKLQIPLELDSLALEIQRSFDYVENYFDVPPITTLATLLMPINTQNIINFLNGKHGITAHALDLSAIIDGDCILSDGMQNICAPVIGASLRRVLEGGVS